jgi:beta-1,2-mannobiose phosphorylase / 1,2-beta-oligomannan phosphorylase
VYSRFVTERRQEFIRMENDQQLHSNTTPLGVVVREGKVLLYHTLGGNEKFFQADISNDGFSFAPHSNKSKIVDEKRRNVNPLKSQDFRFAHVGNKYFLVYKYRKEKFASTYGAVSKDLIRWQRIGRLSAVKETGVVVSDYQYKGTSVMYVGEESVRVAFSSDLLSWNIEDKAVLTPQKDFFGEWPVKVASVTVTKDGILLLYYLLKGEHHVALHAALFDKKDPRKLLTSYAQPVWEGPPEWDKKKAYPVGIVIVNNTYVSYWVSQRDGLFAISHPLFNQLGEYGQGKPAFLLNKIKDNPIIKPIADHFWESRAAFNPGALYEKGRVHMVYRAIGDQDVSVLGYASSADGTNFDERLDDPVYTPKEPFECSTPFTKGASYSPYASGGGCYGGCEDPRLTKIGDKVYMTYVAYDGWNPPRVALTSIPLDDFIHHRWHWEKPVLISRPGQVNKNACLLPEKINGKYVMFHRIYPDILIDYVDDLDFDGKTRWLVGHDKIAPRPRYWDSRKVGVGAPPIKTDDGWLLIYQAVGDQDSARYKMGAMLLDIQNPAHVLHRSIKPILEPTEWYENEGYKAGVAYPCGAVIMNKKLHVYYGGADMVTCAATAPIDEFLTHLKTTEEASITPLDGLKVSH